MKMKSKIQLTELNRGEFIKVLENENLWVLDDEKIKFTGLIKTNTDRFYLFFKPVLNGSFYKGEWEINLNSVVFKCFLISIGVFIFCWANNVEVKIRIVAPVFFMFLNYCTNRTILKNRLKKIEILFSETN